jgi:hypothetical protein
MYTALPLLILSYLMLSIGGQAQKIATLEVDVSKPMKGLTMPVSIDLNAITFESDSSLSLVEIQGTKRLPVAFQVENGRHRIMHWLVNSEGDKTKKRVFELVKGRPLARSNMIEASTNDGVLLIHAGDQKLLQYNFKTVYPPPGIDTAFKRSGFIHPVWTPTGKILTRIQPPDHYHHYGIWNPWTHVLFEGDTVDFWNIKERKGTVRFSSFVAVNEGPVYAEYQALHEHVAFQKEREKIALNELQTVRVYKAEINQNNYIVDIIIQLSCASESPFHILEYRYAGLGWRATEKWNKDNSYVLTSGGKDRKGADGTTAKWAIIQGALDSESGGAVMMSHPANYNHPEPLRIWPENSNGGEMFAMFAPTKTKDWALMPGKTYVLRYRFNIFSGEFSGQEAENGWQYYREPPIVSVKTN